MENDDINSPELENISQEESEEKPPEKKLFRGEDASENEDEPLSSPLKETSEKVNMIEVVQKRFRSKESTNVMSKAAEAIKAQTLGISVSPMTITLNSLKQRIKIDTKKVLRILTMYYHIDLAEYQSFVSRKVNDSRVLRTFNNYYLLSKHFAQKALIYFLNSYDETGVVRMFQEFYLEFDENQDKRMQIDELEKCIEFLAKDNFIGKAKMVTTLNEIGVDCSNAFSLFQEGNANKVLNDETLNELFKMFEVKHDVKRVDPEEEYVDFLKFAPIVTIFFFEFISVSFLRKHEQFNWYQGFPLEINKEGKAVFNPDGDPEGLYRIFITQLKGLTDIDKEVVTFKDVSQALITFRSSGYSDSLTMEALERILKEIKELMVVNPVTGRELRKYTIKELLPVLVSKITTEIAWNRTTFRKSIEKYDKKVECYGSCLCVKITKKKMNKMLGDAFCNLQFPNFDQFVRGLDFVLKKFIPTLVSPAAIYIANRLMRTPDTIITEEGFNGEKKIRFNIKYIVTYENLFDRLYYFTLKFQVKLMFVRMLYKTHHNNYKRDKKINSTILKYNKIMQNTSLFNSGPPGKFGNFDEFSSNLLKNEDPEELAKQELARKEMKKKKFLELIMTYDKLGEERKKTKKASVKKNSNKSVGPVQKVVKIEKKEMKKCLDVLQAEANKIDLIINHIELERAKEQSRLRVNNAFPNSEDITPDIVMNLIKNSKNKSAEIERLREYIYNHNENISFQDIQKFLVAEHLKKSQPKDAAAIMDTKSHYYAKDPREEHRKAKGETTVVTKLKRTDNYPIGNKATERKGLEVDGTVEGEEEGGEQMDEIKDYESYDGPEDFEEKYFKDIAVRRREDLMKLKKKNGKDKDEDKDRGCECGIV